MISVLRHLVCHLIFRKLSNFPYILLQILLPVVIYTTVQALKLTSHYPNGFPMSPRGILRLETARVSIFFSPRVTKNTRSERKKDFPLESTRTAGEKIHLEKREVETKKKKETRREKNAIR